MSTQEVIDSAHDLLDEIEALEAKKTAKIAELRQHHTLIEEALAALGVDPDAKPKKQRKTVTDESRKRMSAAQLKRHGKGGSEQNIYAQPE